MSCLDWSHLLSTLIGGLLGIGGGLAAIAYNERRDRRSLRAAFVAELRATLAMVEERDLIGNLEKIVNEIKDTNMPGYFGTKVGDMRSIIFRQNANKIGLLPYLLAERLTIAHYHVGSIAIDLNYIFDVAAGCRGMFADRLRTDWMTSLEFHERLLQRMRETRALVRDVINEFEGVSS